MTTFGRTGGTTAPNLSPRVRALAVERLQSVQRQDQRAGKLRQQGERQKMAQDEAQANAISRAVKARTPKPGVMLASPKLRSGSGY